MNYKITINNDKDVSQLLDIISKLDLSKTIYVSITEEQNISQQALYWIWLTAIEDETGTDRNDIHLHLKNEYLDGKSTKSLDMFNLQKYMMKVNAWAASEIGVRLLSQGDNGFQEFFNKYSKYKRKL